MGGHIMEKGLGLHTPTGSCSCDHEHGQGMQEPQSKEGASVAGRTGCPWTGQHFWDKHLNQEALDASSCQHPSPGMPGERAHITCHLVPGSGIRTHQKPPLGCASDLRGGAARGSRCSRLG